MTAWPVEAFVGRRYFMSATRRLHDALKAIAPAPGFLEVMLPGEAGMRIRAKRLKTGIPLPAQFWLQIKRSATQGRSDN